MMKFIDPTIDRWRVAAEPAPAPRSELLLDPAQWRAVRAHWPADCAVGLRLANTADPKEWLDDLPRLRLIVLDFPKWVDGRAYSQAHLLRARYRYAGELRASGEVLVDMLPLLQRTGFDAVALRADQDVEAARRALGFFPDHYQGDVRQPLPLFGRLSA